MAENHARHKQGSEISAQKKLAEKRAKWELETVQFADATDLVETVPDLPELVTQYKEAHLQEKAGKDLKDEIKPVLAAAFMLLGDGKRRIQLGQVAVTWVKQPRKSLSAEKLLEAMIAAGLDAEEAIKVLELGTVNSDQSYALVTDIEDPLTGLL